MIALSSPVPMIVMTMDVALMENAFASKVFQERTVASRPAPMTVVTMVYVWTEVVSAMLASQVKIAVS